MANSAYKTNVWGIWDAPHLVGYLPSIPAAVDLTPTAFKSTGCGTEHCTACIWRQEDPEFSVFLTYTASLSPADSPETLSLNNDNKIQSK